MKYILFEITLTDGSKYYNKSWNQDGIKNAIKLYMNDQNVSNFTVFKREEL